MKKYLILLLVSFSTIMYSQVTVTFTANTTSELNQKISEYQKTNSIINCPNKLTPKNIAGANMIDKLAAHIERKSFDYITREDLKTFLNYCENANGSMSFPRTLINGRFYTLMKFTPKEGSVSSEFVK